MKILSKVSLFLLMSSLLFSQVSKYEEVSILGEKVYFPKKTSAYLEELLASEDVESYFEITKVYITLHEFSAAEYYLKQYEEESSNYLKIAKLYNLMRNHQKEIEYIEKYLEDPLVLSDKLKYYDYILQLIDDRSLEIPREKYELSKLERLEIFLDSPEDYYAYFDSQEWSELEKELIVKDIKRKSGISVYYRNILDEIASADELQKIYFEQIDSISDSDSYYEYFAVMEQASDLSNFRNDFEKLHYLRYKNDISGDLFKDNLAYKLSLENDISKLLKLYSVESDFKLMYNLALDNDKVFYEFILLQKNNEMEVEKLIKLLDIFDEKFPESVVDGEILKLKLEYTVSEEEKLELVDQYLLENNIVEENIEFILMKLELLVALENKAVAEKLVSDLIFNSYEKEEFVEFYSKLLEQSGRVEELIVNLKNLNDKSYYIEKAVDYSFVIDENYEEILVNYYFEKGDYQKLFDYKDKLTYEMYDELLSNGWSEFLEAAIAKYSIKKEWVDKSEFKYFFFDDEHSYFDGMKITEIDEKDKRTDAEKYYLAKHYEVIGELDKSEEILEELRSDYILIEI